MVCLLMMPLILNYPFVKVAAWLHWINSYKKRQQNQGLWFLVADQWIYYSLPCWLNVFGSF